jgi:hypothetical protein
VNRRIEAQLEQVRRALPALSGTRTAVLEIDLIADSPHPVIWTGRGPYGWTETGCGLDRDGRYTDYVARLCGVELRHRARARRLKDVALDARRFFDVREARP